MICIIPCGGKKLKRTAPAHELYTGPYFKACYRYALSIAPKSSVFILSAKHGLIKPDYPVAPYNLRMGQVGSVTSHRVWEQAVKYDLLARPMIGLGGKDYTSVMREVWPNGIYPIEGLQLGYALANLKYNHGQIYGLRPM